MRTSWRTESENAATQAAYWKPTTSKSPRLSEYSVRPSVMRPAYSAFMSTGWWFSSGASVMNWFMERAPSQVSVPGK